jgi:glycosyltransferase involved in cell wall biosynthesis
MAAALSRFVATAVPGSFPFQTPKLRVLGHGLDVDALAPADNRPSSLILFVGRLMPVKHQATLLRALAILTTHRDIRAMFVGGVPAGESDSYQRSLFALARTLNVADRVMFSGPLAYAAVRDVYRDAAVAVNLSPTGLFDKAALESMISGVPTVVASRSFDELLAANTWLRIDSPEDHHGLAAALERALSVAPPERTDLTTAIRARAIAAHGLDAFMDRLVSLLREAVDGRA